MGYLYRCGWRSQVHHLMGALGAAGLKPGSKWRFCWWWREWQRSTWHFCLGRGQAHLLGLGLWMDTFPGSEWHCCSGGGYPTTQFRKALLIGPGVRHPSGAHPCLLLYLCVFICVWMCGCICVRVCMCWGGLFMCVFAWGGVGVGGWVLRLLS